MFQATLSPHLQPPAKNHSIRSHSTNSRGSDFKNLLMPTGLDVLQRTPQGAKINSPSENSGRSSRGQRAPCIKIHHAQQNTNHLMLSTEGTDNPEAYTDSRKSEQSSHSSNGKDPNSITRGRTHTPGVEPFDEQLDEFSEKVAVSPFALHEEQEEKTFDFCPNRLRARSVLIVQTRTLTPYLSNVKASPFFREGTSNVNSAIEVKKEIQGLRAKAFLNASILDKICGFLEHGDLSSFEKTLSIDKNAKRYRSIFKKNFFAQFTKEPNQEQQKLFWLNSIGSVCNNLHSWVRYSSQKCAMAEDILKDIDRTLPDSDLFSSEEGKNRLFKVLVALSNTYKEMSYVQGMNSLAGIALFYLREEEAYPLMIHLLEAIGIKKIFYPNFEGLSVLNYQLESYLNHYLPEVTQFLKVNSMNVSYYTCSWFITLFADNLPLLTVIKIWNFLFVKGLSFLIQFTLALFSKYKNEIINMDIDEVGFYLKSELSNTNQDDLFSEALKFKVNNRLMKQLEVFSATGKPEVKLVFENAKKPQWHHSDSSKQDLKKKEKSVKPFFKNMINTITIDIPDTVKQFFKKSPSQPQPSSQTLSSILCTEPSDTRGKSLTTLGDIIPLKSKEGTLASLLEHANEHDNESFKSFESDQEPSFLAGHDQNNFDKDISLSFNEPKNQENKRKSIALRLRKSIGKSVFSKTFIEPAECDTERLTYRPHAAVINKRLLSSPNATLPIVQWDEVTKFHSDSEADPTQLEKIRRDVAQLQIVNGEEANQRSSYKSIESMGPGTSDTDFTNVEEDPISVNPMSTRRPIGDYVILNNTSRYLPKTDSF